MLVFTAHTLQWSLPGRQQLRQHQSEGVQHTDVKVFTYVFQNVPVKDVVVAEALAVKEDPQEGAQVDVVRVLVEAKFTAVG